MIGIGAAAPLPDSFRVAVVGAGVSGLTCASTLQARGARVVVFEAARRAGGRAATEITPAGSFDAGAQYFTVHNSDFERTVEDWCAAGLTERWTATVLALDGSRTVDKTASANRYVVRKGMQMLARHLSTELDVRLDAAIHEVGRRGNGWELLDASGRSAAQGGFDAVVLAIPSPAPLLGTAPDLARRAAAIVWNPCWAALLAFEPASGFQFGGAFVNDDPLLAWVTREDSKPTAAAGPAERWVLHATARWSALHLNTPSEEAASLLAQAFAKRFNFGFRPSLLTAHRWLVAAPANPLPEKFLWDAEQGIGAVGDWCGGPRVEGAFLSGRALALALAA